jgi:DNA repair protein RadC
MNAVVQRIESARPAAARRPAADPAPRDRWLLMRLLAAGQSVPRLADRLIDERGSLGSVLSTSDERLRQLGADANGIAMLGLLREAITAVLERGAASQPVIEDVRMVVDALHAEMAWLAVEQVRAVFLNAGRRLIRTEIMGTGSVRAAPVYPREIARRCLELSASAVVLVHNHPSGDPTPSPADFVMTRRVADALQAIEVELVDHIVIARDGWMSARGGESAPSGVSTARISTARACPRPANGH